MSENKAICIVNTTTEHFEGIINLCRKVYTNALPWSKDQLQSHLKIFPEGQLVAIDPNNNVVGMAASLIVLWDDYDMKANWKDFTSAGFFYNHDPEKGKTLYGAEVMVDPSLQGNGIGKMLYEARRNIVLSKNLLRIRAGARLRDYSKYQSTMNAREYVKSIIKGELTDPTLTFQLRQGFHVLDVVQGYLGNDPESMGYAAVIEWLNEAIAKPEDYKFKDLEINK